MTDRDQAHTLVDRVKKLDGEDQLATGDIEILGVEYTLRFTQPEAGRILSVLGLQRKQRVTVFSPWGREYQFSFDSTGPKHDVADALRSKIFDIHQKHYGAAQ